MAEVKRKSGIRSPYAHALARLESLETAYATLSDLVEKKLGPSLGYPIFCDDQRNFPNSTKEDGACVGESDAATLVAQAAARIDELRDKATDYASLERERDHYKAFHDETMPVLEAAQGLRNRLDAAERAMAAQAAELTRLRAVEAAAIRCEIAEITLHDGKPTVTFEVAPDELVTLYPIGTKLYVGAAQSGDIADALHDSAYIAGLREGWNRCAEGDAAGFQKIVAARAGYLKPVREARAARGDALAEACRRKG